MATASLISSSSLLLNKSLKTAPQTHHQSLFPNFNGDRQPISFRIRAAKLPAGVESPKEEPKLIAPFLGFTTTAETWNSRACMIGLIGTFIVELIFHKGILQMIGVDVGKGLDIPL